MATASLKARLTLNDSLFQAGIKRASAAVASFGKTALKIGFTTLAAAVAGSVTALAVGAKHVINLGDDLLRMKRITGLSVSSLFILREAFEQAGTSAESIGPTIGRMQKSLFAAAKGGGTLKKSLEGIGIDLRKLARMKPEEQFALLGKTIDGLPDLKKQAMAMEIFGRAGLGLLPVFAELKDFDSTSLQKQAAVIEKNADAFDNANDAIRRMKTNAQGLFVGLATKVAPMIANLGKRLEAVDFVAWGDKIAAALMNATQMGLALWNDPKGVMGYFWAEAKAYVLQFANWLVDAIDSAFPGMGEAILNAIDKTVAWGSIIIGNAVQFGQVMLAGVETFVAALKSGWEASGIPMAISFIKANSAAIKKEVTRTYSGTVKEQVNAALASVGQPPIGGEKPAADGGISAGAEADMSSWGAKMSQIQTGAGAGMVAKGNAMLAKQANNAANGVARFTRGADHFGANAAEQAAKIAKVKIAPALEKAAKQMDAIALHIKPQAASVRRPPSWFQQRLAGTSTLRGASMAGTLGNPFKSSLMGASLLGGSGAPPMGIAKEDWAKLNSKQRNNFMDAAVARGEMQRPNGMIRAGDKKRREAFEKTKLMERIGVDKTNDILGDIKGLLESGLE